MIHKVVQFVQAIINLLKALFAVNNSGDTYCAVPTNDWARAVQYRFKDVFLLH